MSGTDREGVADPLERAAGRRPEAEALRDRAGSWSYRRLDAEARAVGLAVRREGAGPGEVVAVLLPRGLRAVSAIHGVPRSGAALTVLHPDWTRRERRRYLEMIAPAAVVCGPETTREVASAAPAAARVVLERTPDRPGIVRDPAGESDETLPGLAGPDAVHSLVATSGTTAGPRAVALTLANHLAVARGAGERLGLDPGDRWYSSLSLAHVGGLAMVLRAAHVGCAVEVRPSFDADELSRLMDRGRVTHASLVPVMVRRLLEVRDGMEPPEALRCLLVGGAAAPPSLVGRATRAGYPLALTYGLTEAASQVTTAPPTVVRDKPGGAGPPLPGIEVRIGEEGEILVRGPSVARAVIGGELPVDADGWLRTGDGGRLDGDGHLHVTGRISGRIVTGGVTVDPGEVEAALAEHPVVADCSVVGVPDEEWGESVAAVVVPSEVAPESPDRLRDALAAYCEEALSPGRRPRRWRVVDALPRNANGKPDREALRRLVEPPE